MWLGACGSTSSGNSGTTAGSDAAATSGGNDDANRVKLAQCMRDHGIDVPDDAGASGARPDLKNLDMDKIRSLIQGDCKQYAQGSFGNLSDGQRQEFQDAAQSFLQCVRDRGVDVPDPSGSGGGRANFNQDDPAFKKAAQACRSKLPANLRGAVDN